MRAALIATAVALLPAAGASVAPAGASGSVPDPPAVGVSPDPVAAGPGPVDLRIAGASFGYRQDITLSLDGKAVAVETSDEHGSFDRTVRLPRLPACGEYEVTADGLGSRPPTTAATTWRVTCPVVSASPRTVPVADLPREIGYAVTGFNPVAQLEVRVGDELVAELWTDRDGSARVEAVLPPRPCGPVDVTATEVRPAPPRTHVPPARPVPRATTTVTVRCPDPERPVDPVRPADPVVPEVPVPARLQLNPAVVATGTTTRATGSLFPAGAQASLAWLLGDGSTLPAGTATVGPDGGFVSDLLVMAGSPQGTRELVVTTASGATVTDRALVVAGTAQPGRRGLLDRR